MRRKDREIINPETILEIITSLPICHLAMIDGNKPYGVTLNYSSKEENGIITLYFHSARTGRKAEIWAKNPEVYFFAEQNNGEKESLLPSGKRNQTTHYVSVAGEGKIEEVLDASEKQEILANLVAKFFPPLTSKIPESSLASTSVWKLVLQNITAKANPPIN